MAERSEREALSGHPGGLLVADRSRSPDNKRLHMGADVTGRRSGAIVLVPGPARPGASLAIDSNEEVLSDALAGLLCCDPQCY